MWRLVVKRKRSSILPWLPASINQVCSNECLSAGRASVLTRIRAENVGLDKMTGPSPAACCQPSDPHPACSPKKSQTSLAIFCKVVDNYGDVGICWRLARQLQQEHGIAVTLWVDNLHSFQRICPEVAVGAGCAAGCRRDGAPLARPGRRVFGGRRRRYRHRIFRLRYSAGIHRRDGGMQSAPGLAQPGRHERGGVGRRLPHLAVDASAPAADEAFLLSRLHQQDRRPAARIGAWTSSAGNFRPIRRRWLLSWRNSA